MPVPKYRTSASKRNMRRSHHALKAPGMSICPECQEVKKPHTVCSSCGHYKGKHVLDVAGHSHDHSHDHAHGHDHGHDHK
jgi:large subunit ribosomal protein L32